MKKIKRILSVKLARTFSKNSDVTVPSIISEGTKVKGDIISEGIIHIDGKLEGDVTCNELVIGVKGSVNGAVAVGNLHLYGTLTGKALAENLFIAKTAKLLGDATHTSIAIEPGAYIDGHCIRSGNANNDIKSELIVIESGKRARK